MEYLSNYLYIIYGLLSKHLIFYIFDFPFYRVDAIDDTQSPRSTFEKLVDGKPVQISFIDYYKSNYGIEIKDWDQPLLVSR